MWEIALALLMLSAQDSKPPKAPKVVSLNGCVQPDEKTPGQFTLTDTSLHQKFHLKGRDFREYVGRLVKVDGGVDVKGLKIKGGLQPNANIAGQAGAMDPSRAVVAAAVAEGSVGTVDVQDFQVKTIRPTGGRCE